MDREKITHEWLLSHGFAEDEKESKMMQTYWTDEVKWCKEPLITYVNEDHRVIVRHMWTNRYGEAYSVHIDNQDYESVAWIEILYTDDFENFIKLAYDEDTN